MTDAPLIARSQADAPDIDGRVLLDRPAPVGEFIDVTVTGSQVYDLTGAVAEPLFGRWEGSSLASIPTLA